MHSEKGLISLVFLLVVLVVIGLSLFSPLYHDIGLQPSIFNQFLSFLQNPKNKQKVLEITKYKDPKGFEFTYPSYFSVAQGEDGQIIVGLVGPGQQSDTILADGITMTFQMDKVLVGTLKDMVDERVGEDEKGGDIKIVEKVAEITLGEREGFTYVLEKPEGVYTFYYFPLDGKEFLAINTLVKDPGEKRYQKDVDKILKSLKFKQPSSQK